jgi:hypothetical protein
MVDPVLDQLIDLWSQEEGDVYQVLSHGVEVGSGTLLLEDLEFIEVLSELTELLFAGLPVDSTQLLPYGVHVNYLIREKILIRETSYDVVDLLVAPCEEEFHTFLDFSLPLNKVVIELLHELPHSLRASMCLCLLDSLWFSFIVRPFRSSTSAG